MMPRSARMRFATTKSSIAAATAGPAPSAVCAAAGTSADSQAAAITPIGGIMLTSLELALFRSPWQNGYVERLIGSIRRKCTDHLIVFNAEHL
jgi:hypothetical protein